MYPKNKNPSKNVNILSYCTFAWFIPTILRSYRKTLTEEDLFEILEDQKSRHLGDLLEKHWEIEKTKTNPSLIRAIWKTFGFGIMTKSVIAVITEVVMKTGQCLSFIMLLIYYSEDSDTVSRDEAYIYAAILTLCNIFAVIGLHVYVFGTQILGMQMRVACCSLIYKKSLKLSRSSASAISIGHLVNLITNDASRFDYALPFLHAIWLAPLQLIIVIIILYFQCGWTAAVGIIIFVLLVPIQIFLGGKNSKLRQKIAKITDDRIRITSEILSGIQVIKMYTWEKHFLQVIHEIRNSEVKLLRPAAVWMALITASVNFCPKLGIFSGIIVYIFAGYVLTPVYVFSLVIFYTTLKLPVNMFFPVGLQRCAELKASLKRIEAFLLTNELNIPEITIDDNTVKKNYKRDIVVNLKNVSAKWDERASENTLKDLNVRVENPKLVAVIGPVGSGKSSMLSVILKELPLNNGEIKINGSISYASQETWFFRGSIKENILFGQSLNEERYKDIIRVCALEKDLLLFPHGDQTIVAENGANLSGGQRARVNLARTVYRQADIYLLDDPLSALDTNVGEFIFDHCISKFLKDKYVFLVTNQLQFLKHVDYIFMLQNGKVHANGTYKNLQEIGLEFLTILDIKDSKNINRKDIFQEYGFDEELVQHEMAEDLGDGIISFKVYKKYLQAGGKFCVHVLILLVTIAYQISSSFFDGAIAYWSNVDYLMVIRNGTLSETSLTRKDYIIIFSGNVALLAVLVIVSSLAYYMLFLNCSENLHNESVDRVISAPIKFFRMNPSGRILNRFSRDLGLLDDVLPTLIVDVIISIFTLLGVLVIMGIVNYWLFVVTLLLFILFYVLRQLYLPYSISIKRLEGVTKSPLYTHIKASYIGLSTLRAFKKQKEYRKIYDDLQDIHTSSFFMYLASIHTIGTVVDIICALLVFIVTFSFFLMGDSLADAAGLAITQSILLMSATQWCIRQSCEMAGTMTSVERLTEYQKLEADGQDSKRDVIPRNSWPEYGALKFKDVYLRYDLTANPVLKSINIEIKPGLKVGIVGRTGAGKSSLSLAIFQLAYTDGSILIDDVNIREIPLENLRNKISVIPQEPLLFSDTMRKNLDPFNEFDDSDLWNALAEVELRHVIAEMPQGLLTEVSEGGSNLSVGQRQLVCLARAIIRQNKILIMDEATANVDPNTDAFIQATIRRKFKDCTVLTIAHRLHTIIDSDLIMVMDDGEVKEFDHPHILLESKGMFYRMVARTGQAMSENLQQIAQDVYNASTTTS